MLIATLVVFLLVLGILVFIHEAGHFIMAKRAGMKVEEFGFGFPPKIFGFRRGETEYTINLIPLGGFVKILGENGAEKENPRSFASKSAWSRFQVLIAGVSANVLLAVVFFSIVAFIGVPTISGEEFPRDNIRDVAVMIIEVAKDSPAQKAGMQAGDIILSIKNSGASLGITRNSDVEKFVADNKGKELTFEIRRGKEVLNITALARQDAPANQGATGISLAEVGTVSYAWHQAIWQGIKRAGEIMILIVLTLFGLVKSLILTGHVNGQLSGPVGIAVMAGQTANMGLAYLMQFIAMLSINLAIINALPFPALDGGRILFLAIEKIKGKPVSREWENTVHTAGMVFLLLLMALVTFRDFGTYDVWGKIKGLL